MRFRRIFSQSWIQDQVIIIIQITRISDHIHRTNNSIRNKLPKVFVQYRKLKFFILFGDDTFIINQ